MIGELETFQTMNPLMAPTAPPSRIASTNASGTGMWAESIPAVTAVRPSTDPIERSMLPVMMRIAVPTPAIAMNDMFSASTLMLLMPQKRPLCRPV